MTFPFPISQLEASLLKMVYSEPENQSLSRWLLTLKGRGRVTLFLSLPKLQSPLWDRSTTFRRQPLQGRGFLSALSTEI